MSNEPNNTLVIEVLRPSAIVLPPYQHEGDNLNPLQLEELAGKILVPGENSVTAECWKEAAKNPAIKIALRASALKNKGTGVAVKINTEFNELNVGQVVELISKIEDIERIQAIKNDDTRAGVKKACEKRIDVILADNEKDNS